MKTKNVSSWLLGALAIAAVGAWMQGATRVGAKPGTSTPAKSGKLPTTKVAVPKGRAVATFAAGCFWSMEAIFKQLKGVDKAEPGYAGGFVSRPSYEAVGTGQTGHAEALQVIYDPKVISYADLLQVLLTVRNPTTLNQQGNDVGPQYRSVIFAHNAQQAKVAREELDKIAAANIWKAPLVTPVVPFSNFYRAEDYHLDYYNKHPDQPYCASVVGPEIEEFHAKFKHLLKSPAQAPAKS